MAKNYSTLKDLYKSNASSILNAKWKGASQSTNLFKSTPVTKTKSSGSSSTDKVGHYSIPTTNTTVKKKTSSSSYSGGGGGGESYRPRLGHPDGTAAAGCKAAGLRPPGGREGSGQ